MPHIIATICAIVLSAGVGLAQSAAPADGTTKKPIMKPPTSRLVEIEMMTHPEIHAAIHEQGKTTVLVYNGGTEQRGPQNVVGGHTLMGRATVKAIAEKLGNALAAPVMPFSPNNANPDLPGTIGLPGPVFAAVNEAVVDQMAKNGFKHIVLMGDHGGGQNELKELATSADQRLSAEGVHVHYCGEVYSKANGDFDEWLKHNGYPPSSHGGIPDTSEMLYLGGDKGWVRKALIAAAIGDPVIPQDERPDPSQPRINNGITGDGRRSSAELGRRLFNMKVDYAVAQITRMIAESKQPRVLP